MHRWREHHFTILPTHNLLAHQIDLQMIVGIENICVLKTQDDVDVDLDGKC